MSTSSSQSPSSLPIYRTERVIASLTMAWVIILTTYMIFQDHALSHTSMYFLKIILSMSGAVMLATLPGFIDVNYSFGGFSVRAAGGAAAFVFIYTQSPNLPVLKLDPAAANPITQERPAPDGDKHSALSDELPMLVAISLYAPSFSLAPAGPKHASAGKAPQLGSPSGGVSLGEALIADAGAIVAKVAAFIRRAVQGLRLLLDAAAGALRGGIEALVDAARGLLGARAGDTAAGGVIALVTEDVPASLEALLGPDASPVSGLLGGVGDLGTSLIAGLGNTVGGIVAVTDNTVQALAGGLQDTTHKLLDGTEALASGVTGLLDNATGGLTSGLSRPVNALVGGVNDTAGRLIDGVIPVATGATSQVLGGVGRGVDSITNQLNAVSPALVSRIDLGLAGGQRLNGAGFSEATSGLGDLGGLLGDVTGGELGLLKAGADGTSFASRFADPLGGQRLSPGRNCISGCGAAGLPLLGGGGLRETIGGLGSRQGPLLGGLTGNRGLAGGDRGGSGPGSDASARGGLVSSTAKATGSLVKGLTRPLRRR